MATSKKNVYFFGAGKADGQDMALIKTLNEKASLGIWPDITFVLDCPVETGLLRARKRESGRGGQPEEGQDRFEREEKAFHDAVREGYLSLAKADSKRFVVVDATLTEGELEEVIFEKIRPYIQK